MSDTPLIVTVQLTPVLNDALDVTLAAITIVPVPEVVTFFDAANVPDNADVPASTVPPDASTVTLTLGSNPDTVTVFDVHVTLRSTPV
jgi:hypothetical protein